MKRTPVFNFTLIALICISIFAVTQTNARAQDERQRGLRVKVGALPDEMSSGNAEQINLWAVVIGVSRYKYGDQNIDGYQISNLKNAADDAQAIYEFLKSPEGGGFRDQSEGGHLILLKDEQATKANVESALDKLKQAKPNDYFVIYIAAHGTITPSRDPRSNTTIETPYFVLYDTDLRDTTRTAMRMERFQQVVSQIPARKGLVLSDTCHSGGVQLAGRDAGESSKRANVRYLEEINQVKTGVGFISASDQLEQSFERDDLNQGVFTYSLLQGLSGDADTNFDGKVTFNEVSSYLRDEVPRLTDNKQHPKSNTTALSANALPLSVVSYADVAATGRPEDYGLLVIRTPDLDGVEVAIDGRPFAKFTAGAQRAVMAKIGSRSITFSRGEMRREIKTSVEPDKPSIIEVNLSFSESYAVEDSLVDPTDKQVSVFMREDKPPSKDAKDLFTKGVDQFNKQRFDDAIESFNRAIRSNAGAYADAFVYRGRAEQSLDRKEAAIASFKAALQIRPTDFETQTLLAEAKFNAGYNVEEVVSDLRGIIRRHPNFDFARVVYGDVLLARKDFARAEIELRRAITINPKSPPAHLILADVLTYQESKDKLRRAAEEAEKAVELLEEISKKQVSFGHGLKRLSIFHVIYNSGRYRNEPAMAEARQIAAKAIARMVERDESISNPDSYLARAQTHIQESIKLAQGLADKRRLVLSLDTSAQINLLKGDLARAIDDAEKSLKMAQSIPDLKDFYEAHYTLYSAYSSDQKFAKAAEHLQKYIELAGSQLSPDERRTLEEELKRVKRQKDANRQKG